MSLTRPAVSGGVKDPFTSSGRSLTSAFVHGQAI